MEMENNESEAAGRALASVADGKIIAVGELGDGVFSKRAEGDGFAVLPSAGLISKGLRLFSGGGEITLSAPADGVVTEISRERLTMRTGDGIQVCVVFGSDARVFTEVGSVLRCGEDFCAVPGDVRAVPVLFPEPRQVTELHVSSGFRRSGERAAFYKPSGEIITP